MSQSIILKVKIQLFVYVKRNFCINQSSWIKCLIIFLKKKKLMRSLRANKQCRGKEEMQKWKTERGDLLYFIIKFSFRNLLRNIQAHYYEHNFVIHKLFYTRVPILMTYRIFKLLQVTFKSCLVQKMLLNHKNSSIFRNLKCNLENSFFFQPYY